MKINIKFLTLIMFVMLICCVSAVSATDLDNITVPDDTDVIEIDEAVDSVGEVESEEISDDVATSEDSKVPITQTRGTVTPTNYGSYFDSNGYITTSDNNLIFNGNFENLEVTTFKINKTVVMDASAATFTNIGFDLIANNIKLNGGTFITTTAATNIATINVGSSSSSITGVEVNGANIDIDTPSTSDYFAINVLNAANTKLLNNVINYEVPVATTNYNHIIRVVSSSGVTVYKNNITGKLPLKAVDFTQTFPSIYTDQVAGVAVQSSNGFNFTGNKLDITGNDRLGYYPTLDALIIVQSANSYIAGNTINLRDVVSGEEETNYLYAVDVYECDDITIDANVININSDGGNLTVNGTGAAYGVQLTGPHTGVVISNNNITTANNGPNLGIYSQNYYGDTSLTIYGNNINVTGRAGDNPWALVSGMELQDDAATVYQNTIYVNNLAGYDESYCAYGISYSQTTFSEHLFYINYNHVTLINGDYAIYISYSEDSVITYNELDTTNFSGDGAVYIDDRDLNTVEYNY